MLRAIRLAVAMIVALAVAALPVMLDRCAASCEAHQATVASTPSCHHATALGAHLAQVPAPCGHDHNGTSVTAANGFAPSARAFALTAVLSNQPVVAVPAGPDVRVDPDAPPNSPPTGAGHSLPLRI
jgi:hypothetical protein